MKKVKDLDGNEHKWSMIGYTVGFDETKPRSKLHLSARELIKSLFPASPILEEVLIPITKKSKLYLDFYLKIEGIAVEVQGEQHFNWVPHFHKSKFEFYHQQRNDKLKADWCDLNGIDLITLPYNEDIDEWRSRFSKK